jgi:hypothetical protein
MKLYDIVSRGAKSFKTGESLYRNLKQLQPQAITLQELKARCTVCYTHQLSRLAAASAPGHELTGGLSELQIVNLVT